MEIVGHGHLSKSAIFDRFSHTSRSLDGLSVLFQRKCEGPRGVHTSIYRRVLRAIFDGRFDGFPSSKFGLNAKVVSVGPSRPAWPGFRPSNFTSTVCGLKTTPVSVLHMVLHGTAVVPLRDRTQGVRTGHLPPSFLTYLVVLN